jgi:4-hydroxy-3-polyprenylbenzoate decarboxylase
MKRKIVIAVTGASGSLYAKLLFRKLLTIEQQIEEAGIIFSKNARDIWHFELNETFNAVKPFREYGYNDFYAPFASGSCSFDTMIICPCSMGTLGRIASGTSEDMVTRTADMMLKERRRLILVPRESPYNLIHIENMKSITLAGGIICPASPSFYNKPGTIEELAGTIVDRILVLAGFKIPFTGWGE